MLPGRVGADAVAGRVVEAEDLRASSESKCETLRDKRKPALNSAVVQPQLTGTLQCEALNAAVTSLRRNRRQRA